MSNISSLVTDNPSKHLPPLPPTDKSWWTTYEYTGEYKSHSDAWDEDDMRNYAIECIKHYLENYVD